MPPIDLKTDRLLALLDIGKLPIQMALKPDGGEIFVSNFDSNSFSIVEAYTNEVSGSYLIGSNPGAWAGDLRQLSAVREQLRL